MENATEALLMAGSVLLLIVALTVSISSLTLLRTQVDEIISIKDDSQIIADESGNYINYIAGQKDDEQDVRIVGIETVMSAARRVRKERYTMYICFNNNNTSLTKIEKYMRDSTKPPYNYDLNEIQRKVIDTSFIDGNDSKDELDSIRGSLKNDNIKHVVKLSKIGKYNKYVDDTDVFTYIYNNGKDKIFKEYMGLYQEKTSEGVLEGEKLTYKILTFVEI